MLTFASFVYSPGFKYYVSLTLCVRRRLGILSVYFFYASTAGALDWNQMALALTYL